MKKNFKSMLVLLLVLVQLFVLSGCSALDALRNNQAFYNQDGDILWNGSTYKQLPTCPDLYPEISYETTIYVTEPDVPVLLSAMFHLSRYTPSEDCRILMADDYDVNLYYCEASIYEDLCARIRDPFVPELVCYSYDVFDDDPYTPSDTAYYTLTPEQVEVITTVVENTEPTVMRDGMTVDHLWSVYLEECSKDMLFRRNSMDIFYTGNTYYLLLYTDQEELLFTVPAGCNDQFDLITAAQRQSYEAWEAFWEDEEAFI